MTPPHSIEEAFPIRTDLRPDYFESFPRFTSEALLSRTRRLSFEVATLLDPSNILRLIEAEPRFEHELHRFLRQPFEQQRRALGLVLGQANISDCIQRSLTTVPRHVFAPEPYRVLSYLDAFLPWNDVAGLTPPSLVALMLQRLRPAPGQTVVEIGAGSGYHMACAYEVMRRQGTVVGFEIDTGYAEHGRRALSSSNYPSVRIIDRNGLTAEIDATVDCLYATAAGVEIHHSAVAEQMHHGASQCVRPITSTEFASESPQSWLRRRYGNYAAYISGDWTEYGCLATYAVEAAGWIEQDLLYDIALVTMAPSNEAPRPGLHTPLRRRPIDRLLEIL